MGWFAGSLGAAVLGVGAALAAPAWAETPVGAVVSISVDCVDQESGAVTQLEGAGVVVTAEGGIVTAHHVVACPKGVGGAEMTREALTGRLGSRFNPPRQLDFIDSRRTLDIGCCGCRARIGIRMRRCAG